MLKRLLYWMFAGALWIAGCASVKSSPFDSGEYIESDSYQTSTKPSDGGSESIYLVLAAEIAGQRGQFDVALDHYLKLAHLNSNVKVAERATQIALYVKNTDKALEAASLWAERDPKSLVAQRVVAMLRLKAGDMDKALEAFGRLFEMHDPELENTLIELVKWMDAELPREQALKTLQALAEEFPKVPEVHFAYALLASNKGDDEVAKAEVERALALRPNWSRAQMLQVQIVSQSGDVRMARPMVEKALKADPNNARLRLVYAQMLAKSGDLKSAERELQRIVLKDYGDHDARFALASVWMEMGQYDRASHEFEALSGDPRWQDRVDFSLGLIEARQNRLESAIKRFDGVPAGPLQLDARVNAVSALMSLGRHGEARERLASLRKSFPNEALRLYVIEAEMLSKNKDDQAAFDMLNEALREMPGQAELLYSRALIAEQLGRMDILESDLRALLEKKPDDPSALNALGFSLAENRLDRLDEAEGYIKRALEKRPGDPAILDSYGWVLYRKGQHKGALVYLRKAYGLYRDPEIAAHLGEVLWVSGQRAEAKKIWREGYKKNPEQDDIKRVKAAYPEAFLGVTK